MPLSFGGQFDRCFVTGRAPICTVPLHFTTLYLLWFILVHVHIFFYSVNSTYCIKCRLLGARCNYCGSVLLMNRTVGHSPHPTSQSLWQKGLPKPVHTDPRPPLMVCRNHLMVGGVYVWSSSWFLRAGEGYMVDRPAYLTHRCVGGGGVGGRIRRKDAPEHRTRDPVTLHGKGKGKGSGRVVPKECGGIY
jgi:hypothetical protein